MPFAAKPWICHGWIWNASQNEHGLHLGGITTYGQGVAVTCKNSPIHHLFSSSKFINPIRQQETPCQRGHHLHLIHSPRSGYPWKYCTQCSSTAYTGFFSALLAGMHGLCLPGPHIFIRKMGRWEFRRPVKPAIRLYPPKMLSTLDSCSVG